MQMPNKRKMPPSAMPPRRKMDASTMKRVFGFLFKEYPGLLAIVCVCILISSVTAAIPAVFQQQILSDISR